MAEIVITELVALAPPLDQVPPPNASVDMGNQQILNMRVENRTTDPSSPAVGRIWLRTDL